jgi:hypothetical protein
MQVFLKPLVGLEHLCYNGIAMASNSSHPTSLPVYLSACRQKAFDPFRFQGQTIARLAQQAALPAVSRPIFGSDIEGQISFCPVTIAHLSLLGALHYAPLAHQIFSSQAITIECNCFF